MLGAASAEQWIMLGVFVLSTLLNVAYMMVIPIRGFLFQPKSAAGTSPRIKEAPFASVAALTVTAVGSIVVFFYAQPLYQLVAEMFRD